MDSWFDRVSRWWKQGNAMAMLTGERGLDEVQGEQASAAEPSQRDAGSSEASPVVAPRVWWQRLVRRLGVLTVVTIILTLVSIIWRTG